MKHIIFSVLLISVMFTYGQTGRYSIEGEISSGKPKGKIYLKVYGTVNQDHLDSVVLNNGHFHFEGTVDISARASLYLDHTGNGLKIAKGVDYIALMVAPEKIYITTADSLKNATIKGSKINDDWLKYQQFISGPTIELNRINNEFRLASSEMQKDTTFKKKVLKESADLYVQLKALQKKYIITNPGSAYNLYALLDVAGRALNSSEIEPLFKLLPPMVRKSIAGLALKKEIDRQRSYSEGALAPDFVQNDVKGKPVRLSQFKGKYVLLDFWASWCLPCRAEMPNVVNTYQKYKSKNFIVVSISLDKPDQRAAWITAVKKEKMTWVNLSDLKFHDNEVAKLYHIEMIPQNFLIDTTGKIVGKNLMGTELDEKLSEIFK